MKIDIVEKEEQYDEIKENEASDLSEVLGDPIKEDSESDDGVILNLESAKELAKALGNSSERTNIERFKSERQHLQSEMKRKNMCLSGFLICLIALIALPCLVLLGFTFGIAGKYSDVDCGGGLVRLHIWLIISGVEMIISILAGGIFTLSKTTENGILMCMALVIVVPVALFFIPWNIIGAVALFRDSRDCYEMARPMWNMTLTLLILQWITIISGCCSRREKEN